MCAIQIVNLSLVIVVCEIDALHRVASRRIVSLQSWELEIYRKRHIIALGSRLQSIQMMKITLLGSQMLSSTIEWQRCLLH